MNYKVIRRAIGLCWIIFVVCFILKAIGADWFALSCSNTYLERHPFVCALVSSATSYGLFTPYYLAICEVEKFEWWIHLALLPYFIGITALKMFAIPPRLYFILDLISNFVVPALLLIRILGKPTKKVQDKYFRIIIAYALNCGFQAISVMVRDVAVSVTVSSVLAQLILSIDVFIMLALYWLYSLLYKKEVCDMGLVFTFLLGKNKEELTELLSEVNSKLEKDPQNTRLLVEKETIEKMLEDKE